MNRSTPGLPVHHQLPKFIQTHVHRVGDAIQPSHPLLSLLLLPPIPPSIRVFSNESTLHLIQLDFVFSFQIPEGFPGDSVVNNLPSITGDTGSVPDLGRLYTPQNN